VKAPNAVPIENHGKGFVRHPVFVPKSELPGPPGSWTDKHSHPSFLAAAAKGKEEEMAKSFEELLDVVVAEFCSSEEL